MAKKKRLGFIDLAKAIAFAMVVCGHTFVPGSRLRAIIYSFHMPLYFILAGYTFSKKPMTKTIVNSAKRLMLPYALYFIAASAIPSLFIWTQEGRLSEAFSLAKIFFFVAGDNHDIAPAGAIWTLVALYLARVILNALAILFEKHGTSLPLQGIICAAITTVGFTIGDVLGIWLPLCFDIGLAGVFFMWSGYAMQQLEIVEKPINPAFLLIPLAIWALEIGTGLPGWNQAISMVGREYRVFPLAVFGAISASYLLIKACHFIESVSISWDASWLPRRAIGFGERIGRASLKLYLIHCLDFNFSWGAVNFPLFGSTALTAAIARLTFDILILLLFESI